MPAMYKPLYTHFDLDNLSKWHKFTLWFPFLGINFKITKSLNLQLSTRTEFPIEAWSDYKHLDFIIETSKSIAEINCWPNHYFLPDDPFELVIYPFDDGLEMAFFLGKLEKKLDSDFLTEKIIHYGYLFKKHKNNKATYF